LVADDAVLAFYPVDFSNLIDAKLLLIVSFSLVMYATLFGSNPPCGAITE
jgi:hypothetical protein